MKTNKIYLLMLPAALLAASCNDIDDQDYEGGRLSTAELNKTVESVPERIEASFAGMFNLLGKPGAGGYTSVADDFGAISAAISLDAEGADLSFSDNGYNWFSAADELTSRTANYRNPYLRYVIPYRQIGIANEVIASYPEGTTDENAIQHIAQARAMIAFDYMQLAPYFQFNYADHADEPCVPIIKGDSVDATQNPRATVREVYQVVMDNLNYAVEHLAGFERSSKMYIDQHVAYGLRARANLIMGNWADAAADAEKAMEGYTPATADEVKIQAFDDISEHNWIWGFDETLAMVQGGGQLNFCTPAAWLSAFSGDGYAAATGNVPMINKLLYDKIPSTDIRHGWWLDADMHSDNWADLTWGDAKGDAIGPLVTDDGSKVAFYPYASIKFGMQNGVGETNNISDFPLMRVEEMILIQAEGLARSGNETQARTVLENFVRNYRDPQYSSTDRHLSLTDEIWFQRRVELWGEGFFTGDAKRLGKPIVRFHGTGTSNFPTAYQFNIAANDGWLNMRFPNSELDNNHAVVDNTGGSLPVSGQNPELRDGVTD